ncbi:hypothetical protein BH09VER1_BH09VER1_49260 [soil metagenome]
MSEAVGPALAPLPHLADKTLAFALRLSTAENALTAFTSGQIDAIVDPSGKAYLLRAAQEHLQKEAALREVLSTQASLAKDRFLAMLSHELRTPLTPCLLGLEILQRDERLAEALPTLAMIRRNIELQGRLLDELVDFITLGQHKVRLKFAPVDAHEAVQFVVEMCQQEILAGQMNVALDLRAGHSVILADSARLQQVMWNLLKNAVKFSPAGGTITIRSADWNGSLLLEFVDHGIGIEPELLPLIFNPFQQGDHAMQQPYGGLGLGMFIAKSLAEAQHGTLEVASAGRDQGTTFSLTFPTEPPAVEP